MRIVGQPLPVISGLGEGKMLVSHPSTHSKVKLVKVWTPTRTQPPRAVNR